jgi:DNA-binding PadR family transcriptional regulator
MGEFEQAVLLAILHLEDDAYGVEIRSLIAERSGRDVAIGAVYTTLERLARKGYVSHRVGEPTAERGGRAKKFYAVTRAGREALQSAREFMRRMSSGLGDAQLLRGEEQGR